MSEKKAFEQRGLEVGKEILGMKNPLVVHHYDCDGITSGALVVAALKKNGINAKELTIKNGGDPLIEKARKHEGDLIFTDLGSGFLDEVNAFTEGRKIVVIDHHEISGEEKNIVHFNPQLFGFNGAADACAAAAAYYCFRYPELATIALVGIVGDMQDKEGILEELNQQILEEGIEHNFIRVKKDLRMFGRASRNLVGFLSFSNEPFIPGISGNEKGAAQFLNDNSIEFKKDDKILHYTDLSESEQKKLVSALAAYCFEKKMDANVVKTIVGNTYLFIQEDPHTELFDAYEYSTLMNACGRHGNPTAAVNVCLKEPNALQVAREYLFLHRRLISEGINFAQKNANDFGNYYFVDARKKIDDTVIGTIIGSVLNSGKFDRQKPIIGFSSEENGGVKVSGRGTKECIEAGLDLGKLMHEATDGIGFGGGHNIAAGASVKKGFEEEFLKRVKQILKKQLKLDNENQRIE